VKVKKEDIRKAERKGNRESHLENKTGWASSSSPHINKKKYSRKQKHKE
jgi:hypothetical protein